MKSEPKYEFSTSFPVSFLCLHSVVYGLAAVSAVSGVYLSLLSVENKGLALYLHKSTEMWYGKEIRTFYLQKFLTALHKK